MRTSKSRQLLLTAAVAPLILLSACGDSEADPAGTGPTAGEGGTFSQPPGDVAATVTTPPPDDAAETTGPDQSAATAVPTGSVEQVDVTQNPGTGEGTQPSLTLDGKQFAQGPVPFRVAQTEVKTVTEGKGTPVEEGQEVELRYLAVNGNDGMEVLSTFTSGDTVIMDLSDPQLLPGFHNTLPGTLPGEKMVIAMAPDDAFGANGNPQLGIGPEDTLVFYVEVVSSNTPLSAAEGEPVPPKPGLPTVEADGTSAATITVDPQATMPTELVVQPLIKGTGKKVESGDAVKVHYTGVTWDDGEMFDNSYDRGQPFKTALGQGRVIAAWDEGLIGQTVGSRVLIIAPPDQAYGASEGNPLQQDTLVFVVDILSAG